MTKTVIQAGPCRFETKVCAEKVAKRAIKLTVESQCPSITKLFEAWFEANGDQVDGFKLCMNRPGQDPLHQFAADKLPPHAACPVIAGVLRTVEAESGLCVKADMTVTFVEE